MARYWKLKKFSGRIRAIVLNCKNGGESTGDCSDILRDVIIPDYLEEELFKDNKEIQKLADDVLMKLDVLEDEEERGKYFEDLLQILS